MFGNIVAWRDLWEDTEGIYYYDFSTNIKSNISHKYLGKPLVSGNYIFMGSTLYNINTKEMSTVIGGGGLDVYGKKLILIDESGQFYRKIILHDIESNIQKDITTGKQEDGLNPFWPKIYKDKIVWINAINGKNELMLTQLKS